MAKTTADGATSNETRGDAVKRVRVGARGSPLAQAQAIDFAARLEVVASGNLTCTQHAFTTTGDKLLDKTLQDAGGKGLFTRELDLAQLAAHFTRVEIV